jgi:hypothetical protein
MADQAGMCAGQSRGCYQKYILRELNSRRHKPRGKNLTLRSAQDECSCLIEVEADGQYYPNRSQIRKFEMAA